MTSYGWNDTMVIPYEEEFPLLMPRWGYVASAFALFLIGFFGFFLNLMVILLMYKDRQVHPIAYVCTCFISMSFMMMTIWILVAIYFAASIALFCGVLQGIPLILTMWVWYTMVFVCLMVLLTIILVVVLAFREEVVPVIVAILGLLWYILTVYFIFVVNTHRKELGGEKNSAFHELEEGSVTNSTEAALALVKSIISLTTRK